MCNFFTNTFENIENASYCLCYVTTPFPCNCNKERFQKHTCNYIPHIVKVRCTFEISDRLQHGKAREVTITPKMYSQLELLLNQKCTHKRIKPLFIIVRG